MWLEKAFDMIDNCPCLHIVEEVPNAIATDVSKRILVMAHELGYDEVYRIVPSAMDGWAIRFHKGPWWALLEVYNEDGGIGCLITNRQSDKAAVHVIEPTDSEIRRVLLDVQNWLDHEVWPDWADTTT